MNPSTNNPDPIAAEQPAFDPQSVQITTAGMPRSGVEPVAPKFDVPQDTAMPIQQATIPAPTQQPIAPQPTPVINNPPQSYVPNLQPPVSAQYQQPIVPTVSQAPILTPPTPVDGTVAMPLPVQPGVQVAAPPKPAAKPNSTQNTLQIAEIRDGIVIMNDGSYRSVVMVKSINFDLMSPQEQEGVEYGYQSFLNSLYFDIQIFVRSRKVDLRPYVERLDRIRREHDNMLLALLMEDYITYMSELSQQTNIMDKNFYIVIPFSSVVEVQKALTQNKNFLSGVTKLFDKGEQHVVINEVDLENAKSELRNRVQAVLGGLQQCGIQGLPLDTQELIELYYDSYNPDTATRQQLKNIDNLTADVVTKGQGAAPQAHLQRELQ